MVARVDPLDDSDSYSEHSRRERLLFHDKYLGHLPRWPLEYGVLLILPGPELQKAQMQLASIRANPFAPLFINGTAVDSEASYFEAMKKPVIDEPSSFALIYGRAVQAIVEGKLKSRKDGPESYKVIGKAFINWAIESDYFEDTKVPRRPRPKAPAAQSRVNLLHPYVFKGLEKFGDRCRFVASSKVNVKVLHNLMPANEIYPPELLKNEVTDADYRALLEILRESNRVTFSRILNPDESHDSTGFGLGNAQPIRTNHQSQCPG